MSAPSGRGRTALAKWIDIPLLWIGAVGLIAMMVLTVLSSAGNTFFSRPVPDIVTLDEVLMAFVVFLPLAYVQLGRHHIEVTLATDWLPYVDHARAVLDASGAWTGGVIERPTWRPTTRYELIARQNGRTVTDLWYERAVDT